LLLAQGADIKAKTNVSVTPSRKDLDDLSK
jgi:hypothetical protein